MDYLIVFTIGLAFMIMLIPSVYFVDADKSLTPTEINELKSQELEVCESLIKLINNNIDAQSYTDYTRSEPIKVLIPYRLRNKMTMLNDSQEKFVFGYVNSFFKDKKYGFYCYYQYSQTIKEIKFDNNLKGPYITLTIYFK